VFKLPKHGDKDCVSEELFYKLKAKIGVVTTPIIDSNGYPDSFSLTTLVKANPNVKTLRTDVEGNISITLDTDGNIKVK
jgi:beta-lactamase superfamily II metal-dependent hydrolase